MMNLQSKLKRGITISAIIALILMPGCDVNNSIEQLDEVPFITGVITDVREGKTYPSILIEENPEVSEPGDRGGIKIWFIITEQTKVYTQQKDGELELIESGIKSIQPGQKAKGWESGVIEASHPAQGAARRIVIISN